MSLTILPPGTGVFCDSIRVTSRLCKGECAYDGLFDAHYLLGRGRPNVGGGGGIRNIRRRAVIIYVSPLFVAHDTMDVEDGNRQANPSQGGTDGASEGPEATRYRAAN